jgi:hypothetical protein
MLTLYYWPGASSVIPHIALEELGAPYERKLINLAKGEHKSDEADTPCIELFRNLMQGQEARTLQVDTSHLGFRPIQKIATIHASSLDLDQNQILPTLISLTHETEVHLGMSVQSQKGSKCRWHNHRSIRRVSIIT